MQQNTAKVLQQAASANIQTTYSNSIPLGGTFEISAGASYNTSKQESSSQAVSFAKDITNRAMERMLVKNRRETTTKITNEFEEVNKHVYDNRTGNKHVAGIYRFIDIIYRNQIFNYGKRQLFEFILPEPAYFHNVAMQAVVAKNNAVTINKPVDPRTATTNAITKFTDVTPANAAYWAAQFNTEMASYPTNKQIGITYSFAEFSANEVFSKQESLNIPRGYITTNASIKVSASCDNDGGQLHSFYVAVGEYFDKREFQAHNRPMNYISNNVNCGSFTEKISVSVVHSNYLVSGTSISVNLVPTTEFIEEWQLKTFKAIVDAYNTQMEEYNNYIANAKVANNDATTNPKFYREIENTVLKKNCMDYLVGATNLGKNSFYNGNAIDTAYIIPSKQMDDYANLCRFLETAFEWELMSYQFYPFYWASNKNWRSKYQVECDDYLFKNFLQAGMARVVVSVRPGFEFAVLQYMATGIVWDGASKMLIDLDLHKNLAYELANPEYKIEKTWTTKVPSGLTILQSGSAGINGNGLPNLCGNTNNTIQDNGAVLGKL